MSEDIVKDIFYNLVTGDDRFDYDITDFQKMYSLTLDDAKRLWKMFRTYQEAKCPICKKHIDDCLC